MVGALDNDDFCEFSFNSFFFLTRVVDFFACNYFVKFAVNVTNDLSVMFAKN